MQQPIVPYVRRARYSVLEPNYLIKERCIFDYELLYVKEGFLTIIIEGVEYSGKQGDIFILHPRQRHSIQVSAKAPLVQPLIHFDLLYRKNREKIPVSFKNLEEMTPEEMTQFHPDILDQFFSPFPQLMHPHSSKYIEQMIFDLIHAYNQPTLFNDIRLTQLFLRLWTHVLDEIAYSFDYHSSQKEDYAPKIKFFIEQSASNVLTLQDLKNLTHLSQAHIFRVFKKAYGTTPFQYYAYVRVQKAKSMIYNTSMSISEIAEYLGFTSTQNFCRVFKKVDGCSPSTYRVHQKLNEPSQDTLSQTGEL